MICTLDEGKFCWRVPVEEGVRHLTELSEKYSKTITYFVQFVVLHYEFVVGHAEVTDLHLLFRAEEHVPCSDVSMNAFLLVQVCHPFSSFCSEAKLRRETQFTLLLP